MTCPVPPCRAHSRCSTPSTPATSACRDDAVTPQFVDHGSTIALPPGADGYRQILTVVHHVLGIRYTVEDAFATEERVVIRALAHGVGVDAIHGAGADGKSYDMTTVHLYRVEGGRLAEHWGVRDEYGARLQVAQRERFTVAQQARRTEAVYREVL